MPDDLTLDEQLADAHRHDPYYMTDDDLDRELAALRARVAELEARRPFVSPGETTVNPNDHVDVLLQGYMVGINGLLSNLGRKEIDEGTRRYLVWATNLGIYHGPTTGRANEVRSQWAMFIKNNEGWTGHPFPPPDGVPY